MPHNTTIGQLVSIDPKVHSSTSSPRLLKTPSSPSRSQLPALSTSSTSSTIQKANFSALKSFDSLYQANFPLNPTSIPLFNTSTKPSLIRCLPTRILPHQARRKRQLVFAFAVPNLPCPPPRPPSPAPSSANQRTSQARRRHLESKDSSSTGPRLRRPPQSRGSSSTGPRLHRPHLSRGSR